MAAGDGGDCGTCHTFECLGDPIKQASVGGGCLSGLRDGLGDKGHMEGHTNM